jgi:hypothetical protein
VVEEGVKNLLHLLQDYNLDPIIDEMILLQMVVDLIKLVGM